MNDSQLVYELQEKDFHFVVEIKSDNSLPWNQTTDLGLILSEIVGHARIENFFGIPSDPPETKTLLYRIAR